MRAVLRAARAEQGSARPTPTENAEGFIFFFFMGLARSAVEHHRHYRKDSRHPQAGDNAMSAQLSNTRVAMSGPLLRFRIRHDVFAVSAFSVFFACFAVKIPFSFSPFFVLFALFRGHQSSRSRFAWFAGNQVPPHDFDPSGLASISVNKPLKLASMFLPPSFCLIGVFSGLLRSFAACQGFSATTLPFFQM